MISERRHKLDKIDYEAICERCNIVCPEMRSVTEYIRNISAKNSNVRNTVKKLKNGDMSAVKKFMELHLKTALMLSLSAAEKSGLPFDELFSEAVLVISKRADDLANQRVKTRTSVSSLIQKRLKKYIFEQEQENCISCELPRCIIVCDTECLIMRRLCKPELHELINKALYSLPKRYEYILNMKYGINNHKYTVEQIAKQYKLSKQRIYVEEKSALKMLRKSKEYSEMLRMYLDMA